MTEFEKVGWAKALELATTSSYGLSESGSRVQLAETRVVKTMGDLPHIFDGETSLAQTKLDCVDGEIVGVLLAAESDGVFTITNTRNGVQKTYSNK